MERVAKSRWDFFLYTLIGLLTVVAIGVFVVYVPEIRRPSRKWAEFAFYSCFLFICLAKFYWRVRKHLRLWLVMLGALILHLSVYVPLLSRIDHWPSIAYVALMPIEAMVVAVVLKLIVGVLPNARVQL